MKWQPIETAPTGVEVELGRWALYGESMKWERRVGVAWNKRWLWGRRKVEWTKEYTHWRNLPPAPETNK